MTQDTSELPIVPIIMGSRSDMAYAEQLGAALTEFDIDSEFRVASAHKSPGHLLSLLATYEADPRPKVYVTIAGRSNALGGMVDACVSAPVITCPPYSDQFGGADVFSSLRMPSGVAPALVLDPRGAALTVAKILALGRPALRAKINALHKRSTDKLLSDDAEVRGA
ncbi:MAG: 5-(carboxyamino)imidazole ribonucleotide mutase [Myxococcota bacterium]|jgi:5-(carboxyamino)imidazole ribonucleotide mutase